MASIIPGYEYDIFISYRQKDNKYDGWVNEFIDHLKREIEATFKEDVSIYFDENPKDGLLEIHNVDKSLETKLKSLIFIPIISQTYCDPNSFAWQHEFVAFNKMALTDNLGRDVKMASGNVCSRIIPIKIHDLDAADTELIENELGCRLRTIEFIYSSAGVNRPLKPDDNPGKNLNQTYYRDQINKVANAIKDIIYGLHPDPRKRATKTYQKVDVTGVTTRTVETYGKTSQRRRISPISIGIAILAVLVIISLVFYNPKWIHGKKIEQVSDVTMERSIAVLPVSNLTGNENLDYIALGIHDALIGRLGEISSLIVRPRMTTLQFKNSEESIQQIAKKLSVNTIVESSIKGPEDNLQIEVRLVEAFPVEKYIWTSTFHQSWNNISAIYNDIIRRITNGIQIRLTPQEEKKFASAREHNPELLKACYLGKFYMSRMTREDFDKGVKYYNDAMSIDPSDPLPYLGLAEGYGTVSHNSGIAPDAASRIYGYARQALSIDSTITEAANAYVALSFKSLYRDWDFPATERYLKRAMEINSNLPMVHYQYGWYLMAKKDEKGALAEFRKSVEIDPLDPMLTWNIGALFCWIGEYDKVLPEVQKALELDPNFPNAFDNIAKVYSEKGMFDKAIEACNKGIALDPGLKGTLGIIYAQSGQREKAKEIATTLEKTNDVYQTWIIAEIYALLGDKDKALDWIEEAYNQRLDYVPWFDVFDHYKSLYNEPRFKAVIAKINIPK